MPTLIEKIAYRCPKYNNANNLSFKPLELNIPEYSTKIHVDIIEPVDN